MMNSSSCCYLNIGLENKDYLNSITVSAAQSQKENGFKLKGWVNIETFRLDF